MRGDEREAGEVIAAAARQVESQRLGDAAVQQPPPGQAGRLVGEVAQAGMGEVERRPGFSDEAAPQQLIERVDRLALGPTAGVTNRAQVERPPDDRRRRQDLPGGLARRPPSRARSTARTPTGMVVSAPSPAARASTT